MQLDFEPVRIEVQNDYRSRLAQCRQIASDYSFTNIFGWGPEYGLDCAFRDGLVWIRQAKPFPALWAPVGDWAAVDWPSQIKLMADLTLRVIRIPQALKEIMEAAVPSGLNFQESRGQWDYLYRGEDLAELRGNRFHKKKNLVNQFKKKYDYTYLDFGPGMIRQALSMQEDWCTWRDCESHETLDAENKAIERILSNWNRLEGLTGGAIRVDTKLVAYTVAERMPDDAVVIHFEKGDPEYKGSYQAINQLFIQNLPLPVETVNREQDLDDEGLRKAKLSYHPVDYVKKYEILF